MSQDTNNRNKASASFVDINQVIQDIFSDKNTFEAKFRKYEKIKSELENDSQNHIYNHYKAFIKITEELKNVQSSVEKMKTFFLEYEPLLNSLRETLRDEELAQKAKKRDLTINRQIFDFSDEKDDLDSNEVIENIKKASAEKSTLSSRNNYDLTDQVNEVIDKFDISIYEKNYTECIKIYRLFQAMKKSKKYGDIIVNYDIRKNIDFHYNRLVESLISDIFNETTKNLNEIIKYLIEIGQLHKAKIAVLNLKSKEAEKRIKTLIEDNRIHDQVFFELLAREFFDIILNCLKFIQQTFKEPTQGNSYMASFSTWVLSEIQSFYSAIAPCLFESDDIELTISHLKMVCIVFMEKQSEGISLATEFQKIAINDLQELLDEIYKVVVFNLKTSVTGEEYELYFYFPINVLDYGVEISESVSLIDISKKSNPRRSSNLRESTEKEQLPIENDEFFKNLNLEDNNLKISEILEQMNLKLTRSMNYFWNAFFFFLELAAEVQDLDNIPILSSQFFCLIQHKLEGLCASLIKIHFEVLDEKISKSENQALAFLTCLCYSKFITDNMDKIIKLKFSKIYKKNPSWKELGANLAKKYDESIGIFTKMVLLDKVAPSIVKNISVYTKKDTKIFVDKPTLPIVGLASVLEKANETLEFLIGSKHKERILYYMFYSCFLCIDYSVLCLQTLQTDDQQQPPTQIFDRAVLEKFKIDHDSIQMLLLRNQFKLTDCTPPGLYQFIYDINFLSVLYSRIQESSQNTTINTDSLLERLINLYAKERNIKTDNIKFKKEIFQAAIEELLTKGYDELKDKLSDLK